MIKLCAFSDEASPALEGQIGALRRNGISLVELRSVDGVNVQDLSLERAETIAKAFEQENIGVWSLGSPLGKTKLSAPFEECLSSLSRLLALAKVFHAERVRIFSFYEAYGRGEEVALRLSKLCEIAKRAGVRLCLENEKEVYGDTAARTRELLDRVEGLGYVFDPANFLQVGEDAGAALETLYDRADYFHIKDVSKEGEIVPAGRGEGRIASLLERIQGDKVLTLEPHLKLFSGYSAIDPVPLKTKFAYRDGDAAFDAAADALHTLLLSCGYRRTAEGYLK